MSNETTTAVERGSSALSKHPLFGCGCCSDPEAYDSEHPDGCPREDGWTDHDYGNDCWKDQSRSTILTADVLTAALDVEEMAAAMFNERWPYERYSHTFDMADEGQRQLYLDLARAVRTTLLGGVS